MLEGREHELLIWVSIAVVAFAIGWILGGNYHLRRDRAVPSAVIEHHARLESYSVGGGELGLAAPGDGQLGDQRCVDARSRRLTHQRRLEAHANVPHDRRRQRACVEAGRGEAIAALPPHHR